MNKDKQRLGSDPLSWISSTTKEEPTVNEVNPVNTVNKDRPVRLPRRILTKSSQSGLPTGWTRATFIVSEALLDRVKDLAYTERREIKEVVNEALETYTKGKKTIKRGANNA